VADLAPNTQLQRMQMEIERDALALNIKKAHLKLAQLDDERSRIEHNIEATEKSIAEIDKSLDDTKGMKHG
jgi:septal ring factor EnvC (AmiA/AmiB activator)